MSRDTLSVLSLFQETIEPTPATARDLTTTQKPWDFQLVEPKTVTLEKNLDHFEHGGLLAKVNRDIFKSCSSSDDARPSNVQHPPNHSSSPLSECPDELLNGFCSVTDVPSKNKGENLCSQEHPDRTFPPLPHAGQLQLTPSISISSPLLHATTTNGVEGSQTNTGGRGTVSPKEAFLDFDHVHTKLEGEALRRASHKKLDRSLLLSDSPRPTVLYSRAEQLNHGLRGVSHVPDLSPPPPFGHRAITSSPSTTVPPTFSNRIQESFGEVATPEFGLPPHCVPKNAIRWTNHSTTTVPLAPSVSLETVLSETMSRSLASGDDTEGLTSLHRTPIMNAPTKSHAAHAMSQEVSPRGLSSSNTLDMLAIPSRDITPTCEEFSASSSEEASSFESELAVFPAVDRTIDQTLNQCNSATDDHEAQTSAGPKTSSLPQTSESPLEIHSTIVRSQSARLSSCSDCSYHGFRPLKPSDPYALEVNIYPLAASGFPSTSAEHPRNQGLSPESGTGSVESADESISSEEGSSLKDPDQPHSQSQLVTLGGSLSVLKTEKIARGYSESKKKKRKFLNNAFNSDLTGSITRRVHKVPKRSSSPAESSTDSGRAEINNMEKSHKPVELDTWVYSTYPRVTRSLLADPSPRRPPSHSSPGNPVRHSMRGSRQSLKHHSEGGASLHAPRQMVSRGAMKLMPDSSVPAVQPTGPIMCGYMDKKTGERCETMFKRPYDLARHKETIHDVEGPGGDRKPLWTCGQCGGGFSRKDALMRHCRIRNHQASGLES